MHFKYIFSIIFFSIITFFWSCKSEKKVDVSHIDMPLEVVRIDQKIANIKSQSEFDQLMKEYPAFMDLYIFEALGIPAQTKDSVWMGIELFKKDSIINTVQKQINDKFGDGKEIKTQIADVYRHIQHYFPQWKSVPRIYTFSSGFAIQQFVFQDKDGRDALAIGLDMFLYPDFDYKSLDPENTNFSDYITRTWNKEHLARKVAEQSVKEMMGEPNGFKLLDVMIHNGKELYIIDKLLPTAHDSIIHEYTGKQTKWCQENELPMWSYFVSQKLFYESEPRKVTKFVSPAPFTPDMPEQAPGRTANYLGYQIVKAYMDKFPNTTLPQLLSLKNAQEILDKSKYKPSRG